MALRYTISTLSYMIHRLPFITSSIERLLTCFCAKLIEESVNYVNFFWISVTEYSKFSMIFVAVN